MQTTKSRACSAATSEYIINLEVSANPNVIYLDKPSVRAIRIGVNVRYTSFESVRTDVIYQAP